MSRVRRLVALLEQTYGGSPGHGPSVKRLLAGVPALQASRRAFPGVHTIWEVVLHLAAHKELACRRVEGQVVSKLPPAEDWPQAAERTQAAWGRAVKRLDDAHEALCRAVRRLDDARLDRTVPGVGRTLEDVLLTASHHDVHHAGQIALLKKVRP